MRPESSPTARLNARSLRHDLTEAERVLWRHLRRQQFMDARFRRQVPIGPYVADFACLKPRLIIEIDGSQHVEAAAYDAQRDAFLEREGFTVLRFWNNDVLARLDSVMEAIFVSLDRVRLRHPPSALRAPSPSGGREESAVSQWGKTAIRHF